MDGLYKNYLHKSRIFCYPQIGIPRNVGFTPEQTYASCSGKFEVGDMKLTLLYKDHLTSQAQFILKKYVYSSQLFVGQEELPENMLLVWLDFSPFADDWYHFIRGQYSLFSKAWKKKILSFYSNNNVHCQLVNKVIHPWYYYTDVAKYFNVTEKLVRSTKEILDKPDLEKEELKLLTESNMLCL